MTWEAFGVIVGSLVGFATVVTLLALLSWKRLASADRTLNDDVRMSRKDRQAVAPADPDPWWAR